MANGTYGTRKPAYITSNDVDIYYSYRKNRSTDSSDFLSFKKISDPSTVFNTTSFNNGSISGQLNGVYDLRLPLDIFGNPGIYTIYIEPRKIFCTISDVSTLAAYSNIRGVVFNLKDISEQSNGSLIGYRIEYLNDNHEQTGDYKIITSNNRCVPVNQTFTTSTQGGITYRLNNSGNQMFCTVTPSTSMSFNTNLPDIGRQGQSVYLVNTKFNPVMLEVEMVEHDIETVSTMLEGDQIRNLDHGIITTFNSNGEIYHQAYTGNIVNINTGLNHDFKLNNVEVVNTSEKQKRDEIIDNI